MKKSELKQMIKEEMKKVLKEANEYGYIFKEITPKPDNHTNYHYVIFNKYDINTNEKEGEAYPIAFSHKIWDKRNEIEKFAKNLLRNFKIKE
jgi:hypothetical protein